jgi:hypothetical protein
MMDSETPLIYTTRGNLPESDLTERTVWIDGPDETILNVEHWLDGECVKRAVHIYKRRGEGVVGNIGSL